MRFLSILLNSSKIKDFSCRLVLVASIQLTEEERPCSLSPLGPDSGHTGGCQSRERNKCQRTHRSSRRKEKDVVGPIIQNQDGYVISILSLRHSSPDVLLPSRKQNKE
jgi:hypothetical protein